MRVTTLFASIVFVFVSGTAFAAEPLSPVKRAFYSVPVPSELAPFATFEVQNVEFTEDETGLHFAYDLPADLVGPNSPRILLLQQDGHDTEQFRAMIGQQEIGGLQITTAKASCGKHPFQAKKIQCLIVYTGLEVDPEVVASFLARKYANSADLEQRLDLAGAFGHEPAGVLVVELN